MATRKLQRKPFVPVDDIVADIEKSVAKDGRSVEEIREVRKNVIDALWQKQFPVNRQRTISSISPKSKRIVIFAGAGASKPLGYPLTNELLRDIWLGLNDERQWMKWAGFKTKGRRAGARLVDELQGYLRSVLPGIGEVDPKISAASIVDIISMLEYSITERHCPLEPDPGNPRSVASLIRLRHLLMMALNGVLRAKKRPDLMASLASWMVRRARRSESHRVTLVSTNYDTAIESAIYSQLADTKDERLRLITQRVDFGITWRDAYQSVVHSARPSAPLAVFKLHGSLNWLRCETCGHVTINPTERIVSLDFWATQNKYNTCNCGALLKSLLVTPSIVRDIRDPSLLAVWNASLEDLRRADEWVIIGYSLPSEDVAIRSLLLRAFHLRENEDLKIHVVSRDLNEPQAARSTEEAYRLLFPRRNFQPQNYDPKGIDHFVASLK